MKYYSWSFFDFPIIWMWEHNRWPDIWQTSKLILFVQEQSGKRDMKIAVMGAGAIGGYFGGRLAQAGFDVSFIARGAHLAAIRKNGLKVLSPLGDFTIHPELYPRFFIRFFIHAFVMAGKLSLIRLYFNGKWREQNPGKIFIEKILDKKNRNCDYRNG